MSNRILACLAVSLGMTLAACTDRQQVPSGPQFASMLPVSNACDFNVLNSLISSVFDPPVSQTVQNLKQAMENAGAQSATARERGYDIMVEIGKASRSGSPPDPSDGRDLTVGLIRCMFNATSATEFPNFPDPTIYDFAAALNWSTGGGYWIRGGASDSETPALARSGTSNVSGIAPPAPPTTLVAYKWRNTTLPPAARDGILDERVLVYGHPITGGYDWAMIRPNATFDPFAVVALCNIDATTFTMVQESSVGALPFDSATATNICSASPSVSFLEQQHGPFALVSRMVRFGASLLSPSPVYAATMLATASIGGGTKATRSRFTNLEVASVASKWLQAPPSRAKVNTPFTVTIEATTKDAQNKTVPALGVCYTVIGGANNGTPAQPQLTGAHNCGSGTAPSSVTTLVDGKAIATLVVTATQTGNLITNASGVVLGRAGTVAGLTARTNVIP
jgi:hypothetical protein